MSDLTAVSLVSVPLSLTLGVATGSPIFLYSLAAGAIGFLIGIYLEG